MYAAASHSWRISARFTQKSHPGEKKSNECHGICIYIYVCVCACVLCVRVRVADPPPPPDVGINRTLQQHASACLKQKSGAAFHWSGLSIALSNITRRLEAKVRHSVPLVGSPILQLGLLDLCVAVPGVLRRVERTKVLWRLPVHFLCVVGGS